MVKMPWTLPYHEGNMNTVGSLPDVFFKPCTVAVVGASKKSRFGSGILGMLVKLGYGDRLYPINPREKEIDGRPVYARLTDVPVPVDLAIVIVAGPQVPNVIAECVALGIRAVVLESAGFSETGPAGARLEEEVRKLLQGTRTRVIGPNCIGLINTHDRFATTEIDLDDLRPGNIGVIAQSGAFGNILSDWAPIQDLAFSKLITIGNRVDVDEADCLSYLAEDEKTDIIVLYLEGVKDGPRFYETARDVSRRKPIIAYKGGRSAVGRKAAASHTGSMTGEDMLYEGLFRQAGIIRASSFQELFDMARVISREPLMAGPRVCIVTSSGSLGVMAADECTACGLQLPEPSPETVRTLRKVAPPWMNVKNPLDVGPSGIYAAALKTAIADGQFDGIIATPVIPNLIIKRLVSMGADPRDMYGDPEELRKIAPHKPILLHTVGGGYWLDLIRQIYGPVLTLVSTPEIAARSLAALYRYSHIRAVS
jgi:acyl-CoA synthetase (NDP forming)